MKKLTMAALLAGQIASAAPPAFAADFAEARDRRAGAFAGFRLRLPLDGAERRQVRAGLTLAPALHSRTASGRSVMRIGEGLEFGYRANRPLSVSLAGRDLSRLRLGAAQNDDDDGGIPTVALVAGGLVLVFAAGYYWFAEAIDCDADEECS